MLKALEKRLGKVEKTVESRINTDLEEQRREQWREELRRLRSTPEGRKQLRKMGEESVERMLDKFRAEKRAKITAITPPERLADPKK